MDFINFYLIPGIVLGSIYALGAIGVSLVFGILRFANFAHGELMLIGAYITYSLIQFTGLHPLVVLPIAMLFTSLVALGIDHSFYKPFRASKSTIVIVASFGIALMARSAVQIIWGVDQFSYSPGRIQMPMVFFDTLRISPKHIWIVSFTLVLMAITHVVLSYTRAGKAMRAMSDSAELARLTGINTENVVKTTWVLGASLATAAGVFLGWDSHLHSMMGFYMLLPMFAAAILGGIGQPYGAMVGGLIVGLAEELSAYPWIGENPLLSPAYKAGVAFALMIIMLIWRPSGLFRGRVF
jgi:branched-subunit amino acid ABC-type transport system permease component|tara:strand:- start:61 stop:951 length:891 start_codon:yes stop_codon:yes gene_type:complete